MKRASLFVLLFPLLSVGCGPGFVAYAQSLPATIHAQWTPNPASDNVTKYVLTLDGTPIDEPTALDATCSCVRVPLVVPSFGAHTATIRACSLLVSTDPTSSTCGPVSVAVAFTLNPAPTTAPSNGKVTQ